MVVLIDYSKNGWSHLVADSIPNLHQFAKNMGVKKCWYENKRGKKQPHYDIKAKKVDIAIKNGAIQSTSKEILLFLKKHYGES